MHRSSNATPWPYLPVFLPDARGSMAQRRRNDSPQAKLRNGCADTKCATAFTSVPSHEKQRSSPHGNERARPRPAVAQPRAGHSDQWMGGGFSGLEAVSAGGGGAAPDESAAAAAFGAADAVLA
jgi:hypothetical protein